MTFSTLAEPVSSALWHDVSDAEFVQSLPWADEADPALAQAAAAGNLKDVWSALTKNNFGLGSRANRKKVHERRYAAAMSLWSRASFEETPRERDLAEVWTALAERMESARQAAASHQARKKTKSGSKNGTAGTAIKIPRKSLSALSGWQAAAAEEPPTAWELLMLIDLLRLAGPALSAKVGIPLWRQVLTAAGEWAGRSQAENVSDSSPEQQAIASGELPWELGLFFAHIRGSETLREQGAEILRSHLEEHTDTDGTLEAQAMQRASLWLPPLVRAAEWSYAAEVPLWDGERFSALINRVAGCYAGDGHLALDQTQSPQALPVLLTGARLAGGSKKEWPLKFLLDVAEAQPELLTGSPSRKRKHSSKLKTSRRRPVETDTDSLVQQSDWARLACLRNHSGRDADVFAVTHHQPLPTIDLSILGQGILRGFWELEVSVDQKPLDLPEEWTCICWHTDADGDYVELQYTLDENRRIERQMFLSRTDHFLVMADCISGVGKKTIDYKARWPLVENASIERHGNSRECVVELEELEMRTFPLALPDDIVQSTAGFWGQPADAKTPCLELRQSAVGGLYAPVVFDWTPARQNSYADWKTLTITESGPKVQTDRASGHRLRIGNHQLLIYRSLAPADELRTVLGHHTGHETIIARFDKNGDIKPLLIVE